ncbi:hypothetical protein NDU88_010254 [Pleurodeles waltl]|uniref:Uncharacterized protein n=1 Tax=Pleurodeles waltl TaxID=8319 RepID=A0AAV7PVE5_PLEWA|nr:hypothetical protein NDU88_010254 [Pleurodeles waltl]
MVLLVRRVAPDTSHRDSARVLIATCACSTPLGRCYGSSGASCSTRHVTKEHARVLTATCACSTPLGRCYGSSGASCSTRHVTKEQ